MGKEAIVRRVGNLKDKLDAIDDKLLVIAYNGYYESRILILMAMWDKGEAIHNSHFRGVKCESYPSYHKLSKETERRDVSLKQWHELYLKQSDRQEYLPIAQDKARTWTDNVFKTKLFTKTETPELPEGKYDIIYADPPWQYHVGDQHGKEEQETVLSTHYPSMSIEELCELQIPAADNAVLFMWATSPLVMSQEAFQVVSAWGFEAKACFVWDKVKHNVGHYNSVRHEFLLICTKGSFLPQNKTLVDSVQSIERTKHSEKPEKFRKIIDMLYPQGKRIELFARKKVEGWDSYGDDPVLQG